MAERFLQLKRNTSLYNDHATALAGLQTKLAASTYCGEPIIARYGSGDKILFGISNGDGKYQIFDMEASSTALVDAINALDAEVESAAGGHVKVKVTEVNGKLTSVVVTESDIASAQSLADEITRATTVEQANADAIAQEVNTDRDAAITAAIEALDKADTVVDGQFVDSVSESDGVITVSRKAVAANKVTATAITASSTQVAVSGTDVAAQVSSIATTLKSVQDNAAKYKVVKFTDAEVTALGESNVLEAYKVVSYVGDEATATKTQVGDTIKIYKDKNLKGVVLNGQNLEFTYVVADGTENMVAVDVSKFLAESEFSDGLQVVNHIVSVKKDTTSEAFLSVGANGVKVSGVQEAINAAASDEETRAKAAEKEIADKVGLTGAEGARTWTATANYGGATVKANADALDTAVKANADAIANLKADKVAIDDVANGGTTILTGNVQDALQDLTGKVIDDEQVTAKALNELVSATGAIKASDKTISAPNYNTQHFVTNGDNLAAAIGKLDAALYVIDCGTY